MKIWSSGQRGVTERPRDFSLETPKATGLIFPAKAGDAKLAAILLFDAILDEPGAFQKTTLERQQRWLDNANTIGPMYADVPPRVFCEELHAIKVPVLIVQGEKTCRYFSQGNEKLPQSVGEGGTRGVVSRRTGIAPTQSAHRTLFFGFRQSAVIG